jgi:hypothetical protein
MRRPNGLIKTREAVAELLMPPPRVVGDFLPLALEPGIMGRVAFAVARLPILLQHFIVYDRVPGVLALTARDVMFARPAAQPKLFDQVQLRHHTACHNPFLINERQPDVRGENIKSYIGRVAKIKEVFHFPLREFAGEAAFTVTSLLYSKNFLIPARISPALALCRDCLKRPNGSSGTP